MNAAGTDERLRAVGDRITRGATTAWYTLSDEHREWLLGHRRRLVWWVAFTGGCIDPWLLIPIAVAAYFLQEPPRRATSPVLITLCAFVPVVWLRQAGEDLG